MVSLTLNKVQIILISILIPAGILYLFFSYDALSFKKIFLPHIPIAHINDVSFRVEIADSEHERAVGLSGRESLDEIEGLLFVFPEADQHSMWMKDMKFAIDIIWIDENFEIIEIQRNLTPDSWPQKFRPRRPAKYAIETNIHFSDTFGFREGMTVTLPQEAIE